MAMDTAPIPSSDEHDPVVEMVHALQPRLKDLPEASLRRMVVAALDDIGDVRVTTYLPILVERKVRNDMRHGQRTDDEAVRLPA